MNATRPVGAVDTIWLNMDRPNNLMVVESLLWFDEPVDWQRLTAVIRRRLVERYPVFRQRPVPPSTPMTLPRWEDDPEFSLTSHLRRAKLADPGGDAELQAYIEDQMHRSLDRTRALWEMHLIDGYLGGSAVYCRMHHALADGIALAQVLLSLTDAGPTDDLAEADAEETQAPPDPGRLLDSAVRLTRPAAQALRGAARAVSAAPGLTHPRYAGQALTLTRQTLHIADKLLLRSTPQSPLTGQPGPQKRAVWSQPWPVADVKRIGRLSGATVNDVLVSAVSGALHAYVVDHGGDPVDLTTMVPVNLRALDRPLPRYLGNRFALVMLSLPTAASAPMERLAEAKQRMDSIKRSPESFLTFQIIRAIGRSVPDLAHHLVDFFADKTIGVTTNVVGPMVGRYLAGSRISGVLGWAPGSGRQTLCACIFSYDRVVRVGFKADATVIPDPEKLVHALEEEMDVLLRIAKAA